MASNGLARTGSFAFLCVGAAVAALTMRLSYAAAAAPQPSPSPAVIPTSSGPLMNVTNQPNPTEVSLTPEADAPNLTLDRAGGVRLALEDSIAIAIRSATSVLKAQNDLTFTGAQLLQAYGQFLPNVEGASSTYYGTGKNYYAQSVPTYVVGSNTNAGFTLASDLNIFNGLSDFSNLKSAVLKRDSADLTLYRAKQQISLDITQSYLQVILDQKLIDIAIKNLQESREREKLLEEQTNVGARNLSDLFRQQAQTSQDESTLIAQQNRTRTDQIAFLRRLRVDVSKNYHFVEPKVPEGRTLQSLEDENKMIESALARRADLKSANDSSDAAHWDVHTAWGGYLPKIDLIGAMNSGAHYLDNQTANGVNVVPNEQGSLGYQLGSQINYTVGLYLTWNMFDRFVTHENVVRSRTLADDLQIDAEDRKNQVEGDVRQAYGNYITALQQLRASKKGMDAAEKAYEVMEGRYEVGGASFLDLITSQAVLVTAESTRAQALIDFQLQDKALDFALGLTPVD
ncbi:MAG: TolC family protein [Oligoflexia bacterium]|nr:TolC family protein [Oligoflexia bacterium]